MSAVRAEAPQVEWLSADQLAAVDPHELVGTTELLGHAGGVCDPWPARLREAGHAYLEATAEQVWTVVLRSRRWAHDLQRPADLRHHSEVAHHLNSSFEEVVDRLAGPIAGQAGGVRLRCEPGAVTTGPVRFDAEGSLRLPASFPELPVRLSGGAVVAGPLRRRTVAAVEPPDSLSPPLLRSGASRAVGAGAGFGPAPRA